MALLSLVLVVLSQSASAQRPWVHHQNPENAEKAKPQPGSAAAVSGPLSYALAPTPDYSTMRFGVLDFGLGKFYVISSLPTIDNGIAWDFRNELLSLDLLGDLYRINPGNGRATKVGSSGVGVGAVFGSTADGTLYAMDTQNRLYRVDPGTGAASLVGSTGIPGYDPSGAFAVSFAADCRYLYYVLGVYDNYPHWSRPPVLWRIHPDTAVAELVAAITPPLPFFGAAFLDDQLFEFSFDETFRPGGPGPKIYRADTANGVASFVSDLNVPSIYGAVRLGEGNAKHCPSE
jgi:hypothetical protein